MFGKKPHLRLPAYHGHPALSKAHTELCELVLGPPLFEFGRNDSPPYMSVLENLPSETEQVVRQARDNFHTFSIYRYKRGQTLPSLFHVIGRWSGDAYALSPGLYPNPEQDQRLMPEMVKATERALRWPTAHEMAKSMKKSVLWCAGGMFFAGAIVASLTPLRLGAMEFWVAVVGMGFGAFALSVALISPWYQHLRRRGKIFRLLRKLENEQQAVLKDAEDRRPKVVAVAA